MSNQCLVREGLELGCNRRDGFGLAEGKEKSSPRKRIHLTEATSGGGSEDAQGAGEEEGTGLVETKGSCKQIIGDKTGEAR